MSINGLSQIQSCMLRCCRRGSGATALDLPCREEWNFCKENYGGSRTKTLDAEAKHWYLQMALPHIY